MATVTLNMSLIEWDLAADPYDHSQQAGNWALVDAHDHSAGKGKQIPAEGLASSSVTTAKLADSAVTAVKIADGAVTYAKLAADAKAWALGDVKMQWFPSGGSAVIGSAWHVADGSTLTSGQHDFSSGSVTLPNLVDAFPYGVDSVRVGNTGGSNAINLAHNHIVNAHNHIVDAHHHTVNGHTHGVNAHSHSIGSDGSHHHTFAGGALLHTRQANTIAKSPPTGLNDFLQTVYVAGYNSGGGDAVVNEDDAGGHAHGGSTGAASTNTNSASPDTSDATPGTSNTSPGTSSALGNTDTRPAWIGLLPLIRIRN